MLKNYTKFTIDGEDADGQTLKSGKDYECRLLVQGANQTGAVIKFLAKRLITDPDSASVLTKEGSDVTTTIGTNSLTAVFLISGTDTENLQAMELIYGIQRTLSGKDTVIEEGKLKIEASVIR